MTDNERKFYLFSILALVLALAYGIWEHGSVRELKEKLSKRDTIKEVVVKVDTIRDSIPKVVKEKEIGYIKVPVYKGGDNISTHKDEVPTIQPIFIDTLSLPLTQKEYSDDSTYTAWVSGYLPCLDSIKVYRKTVYEKQTITLPAEKKKRTFWQRFGLGVQAGYGLGLDDKKAHPYVGVGVGFNF